MHFIDSHSLNMAMDMNACGRSTLLVPQPFAMPRFNRTREYVSSLSAYCWINYLVFATCQAVWIRTPMISMCWNVHAHTQTYIYFFGERSK